MTIIQCLENIQKAIRSINAPAEVHDTLKHAYDSVYQYISGLEAKVNELSKPQEVTKIETIERMK